MKRNLHQRAARAAQLLLCAAAISVPVTAQQAPPSADTFALNATPKANFGPSPITGGDEWDHDLHPVQPVGEAGQRNSLEGHAAALCRCR